jgi:hypothetical protein
MSDKDDNFSSLIDEMDAFHKAMPPSEEQEEQEDPEDADEGEQDDQGEEGEEAADDTDKAIAKARLKKKDFVDAAPMIKSLQDDNALLKQVAVKQFDMITSLGKQLEVMQKSVRVLSGQPAGAKSITKAGAGSGKKMTGDELMHKAFEAATQGKLTSLEYGSLEKSIRSGKAPHASLLAKFLAA